MRDLDLPVVHVVQQALHFRPRHLVQEEEDPPALLLRMRKDPAEVRAAHGQHEPVRLERGVITAAQGHVSQVLALEQLLCQREKVGLVIPPLEKVLILRLHLARRTDAARLFLLSTRRGLYG